MTDTMIARGAKPAVWRPRSISLVHLLFAGSLLVCLAMSVVTLASS